jgi:hypothetical protein
MTSTEKTLNKDPLVIIEDSLTTISNPRSEDVRIDEHQEKFQHELYNIIGEPIYKSAFILTIMSVPIAQVFIDTYPNFQNRYYYLRKFVWIDEIPAGILEKILLFIVQQVLQSKIISCEGIEDVVKDEHEKLCDALIIEIPEGFRFHNINLQPFLKDDIIISHLRKENESLNQLPYTSEVIPSPTSPKKKEVTSIQEENTKSPIIEVNKNKENKTINEKIIKDSEEIKIIDENISDYESFLNQISPIKSETSMDSEVPFNDVESDNIENIIVSEENFNKILSKIKSQAPKNSVGRIKYLKNKTQEYLEIIQKIFPKKN